MVPVAPAESLSVEAAGRGARVVLIPGVFGWAFGFRKLVPLLVGAGYRTIVIEPLGVGASARPEKANYSLTAQADRIAAVLDSLHVRNALVLAHSIGGSEAVRLRAADRMRSEEHTSELQSQPNIVCRLLLGKKHTQRARMT